MSWCLQITSYEKKIMPILKVKVLNHFLNLFNGCINSLNIEGWLLCKIKPINDPEKITKNIHFSKESIVSNVSKFAQIVLLKEYFLKWI